MSTMRASDTPAAFSAGANPAPTVSLRLLFLFILLLASTASLANGRIGPFNVYTIDGRFADPDRTSTLYRIDPDTGEVLETIGDTGLRLNAITMWPQGSRMIGVTSADDTQFPDHLVAIDRETGSAEVIEALVFDRDPLPPDAPTVFDFTDIAAFESKLGGVGLALIRRAVASGLFEDWVLWESEQFGISGSPSGRVRPIVRGLMNGSARSGQVGLAAAKWDFSEEIDLALIGCTDSESFLEEPDLGQPFIDPPPPPVGADLPHPNCYSAALEIGVDIWLGVQADLAEAPPRRLTRLTLDGDQASLEDLGPLPDDTVGIAFGPAFPVEPVPALSRMALIVLLGLVAAVVVLRRRARA